MILRVTIKVFVFTFSRSRLGCFDSTHPQHIVNGPDDNPISRSLFLSDQAISSHPRFPYVSLVQLCAWRCT